MRKYRCKKCGYRKEVTKTCPYTGKLSWNYWLKSKPECKHEWERVE